jgi:hypothetical protein
VGIGAGRRAGLSEWTEERLALDSMLAREDNLRVALDYLGDVTS